MTWDLLRFVVSTVKLVVPFVFTLLRQQISAALHKRSYKLVPASEIKNVVVIGGSFGGTQAVKRLAQTLPSGYRVILVEKNSHLNYVFAFPRFSVVKGWEKYAFIPYTGIARGGPDGIYQHIQDTVVNVGDGHVELKSGQKLDYEYLLVATGTSSALPSKVSSTESHDAQEELRGMQSRIENAKRIAVVGGGAVGVELATDIKSFYSAKEVSIVHSRGQLLNTFGKRLHDETKKTMEEMGIRVFLNQRPRIPENRGTMELNGKQEEFDLIVPCIGQRPNSSVISSLSPASISKETAHILVQPTLQLADTDFPRVFAFGDVAATGGPKMGRAAYNQSEVAVQNILAMIQHKTTLITYKPQMSLEGTIKLTLGEKKIVIYTEEDNGRDILVPLNFGSVDMQVKRQWGMFGADVRTVEKEGVNGAL